MLSQGVSAQTVSFQVQNYKMYCFLRGIRNFVSAPEKGLPCNLRLEEKHVFVDFRVFRQNFQTFFEADAPRKRSILTPRLGR